MKKTKIKKNGLWRLAFDRMTAQVDFRTIILHSAIFAGVAVIATIPYFYYLMSLASSKQISATLPPGQRLVFQLLILFIICMLSAITGFALGPRYSLPGFGKVNKFIQDLPFITAIGFLLVAVSYVLFDRHFYRISPAFYPVNSFFIASMPLKGAFTDELILRFGLVTIGAGLFKNRMAGILPSAVLASFLSLNYLKFMGVPVDLSSLVIGQAVYTFLVNCILGLLFVSRGLIYAMGVKFIIGLKFLVVILLV